MDIDLTGSRKRGRPCPLRMFRREAIVARGRSQGGRNRLDDHLGACLLLPLLRRLRVIRTWQRLVARLLPGPLERLRDGPAPGQELAAYHVLDGLPRPRRFPTMAARPLDHEVECIVPPEERVWAVLADDGHHAVALQQVAERAWGHTAEDDCIHQLALQSATRTRPSR